LTGRKAEGNRAADHLGRIGPTLIKMGPCKRVCGAPQCCDLGCVDRPQDAVSGGYLTVPGAANCEDGDQRNCNTGYGSHLEVPDEIELPTVRAKWSS